MSRPLRCVAGAFLAVAGCSWAGAVGAQQPAPARVVVDAASVEGRISPLLYGQFLEFMYEGVKEGLTAELLQDRGFEQAPNAAGLPRDWERYPDTRNDDYGLDFAWDDSIAFPVTSDPRTGAPVQHSLRVRAGGGVIERHGVYQSRIPVRAGVEYEGYVWLRTDGYDGPVRVALEEDVVGGGIYAETVIPRIRSGGWERYDFSLVPDHDDPLARFALLFPGRGRVWVDQLSLMPGTAVAGMRSDVLDRIRALEPAFLRWPGGNVAQDYHWEWGIGPRDRRPDWINLSWDDEREPGDFGTAEYVRLSRLVGAEPTITVNVEGRGATPEEAAAWVEYCNGPVDSRYGALRAEHGFPEPFDIRYWELGNEIWGDWVRGHSDAETYARNYRRYHEAMIAVDSTLRFIAVGDNDMEWNRTVVRRAGDIIDYLAIHHYYGRRQMAGDPRNLMARPLHYERFYEQVEQFLQAEAPGVRLAINEWGLDIAESSQRSMLSAVYGARLMNVFERASPRIAMTAVSDLVNGWPGGIIQASRHDVFVSPLYHVNRMWATRSGRDRLRTRVAGPTFDTSREGRDVASLDAVASRAADGDRIHVKLVNASLDQDLRVQVELENAETRDRASLVLLSAPDLHTTNGFSTPAAIAPREQLLSAGTQVEFVLPKHSAAIITFPVVQ